MKNYIKYAIYSILTIIVFVAVRFLLKSDSIYFYSWWLTMLVLGIGFMPFTHKLFSNFHDNGYLFSKTIGIAISGYLMWFLSSIKILKFTSFSCILVVTICIAINLLVFIKSKSNYKKSIFSKDKINSIVTEELLFLIIFLVWTYIRGFKPEAYGTEKFMDYGFMTTMMRADYMPPQDLWFAGSSINYYYVGQYLATFMTKLSLVPVNVGYNLMLMMLAAFGFMLPYSLVINITRNLLIDHKQKKTKISVIAGLLSGAGVTLASNMHFPLFYWIVPILRNILGVKDDGTHFWFPNSTRYIGYNPETTDKTIHEFPSYSFVLGDLHAHVINIIFVITILGVLFAWLLHRRARMELKESTINLSLKTFLKECFNPYIIVISFFIGLFHTTNFWDFPIYFVVSGAVILLSNAVVYRFRIITLGITAIQGIVVIAIGELIALPFTLNFDQISTEICLTVARTPLYQLIILWGLPIVLIVGLLIELISKYNQTVTNSNTQMNCHEKVVQNYETNKNSVLDDNELEINELGIKELGVKENIKTKKKNKLYDFIDKLNVSDLFILILGFCALGLVLIPEIIYVKDIYSGDFKRANTMFKLTYQAFIMFGICSGYIFTKFIKFRHFRWQLKFTIVTLIMFLSSLWYTKVSVSAWYGNILQTENYKGLDAAAFLETTLPDDYLATKWINDNIKDISVVLEANGDSYSDYERVSVVTGMPTVLGWYVHEWLWRGDTIVVDGRAEDIKTIYTSDNIEEVKSLINKYNIDYIYVGKLERDKYSIINNSLLKELGEVVFNNPINETKDYETYIVRVDKVSE
jgi:YYY domain-containing protein